MHDEQDRRQVDVDRADRALIEQAAAQLRQAERDVLARQTRVPGQHFAFGLALPLDELALHLRDLDAGAAGAGPRGRADADRSALTAGGCHPPARGPLQDRCRTSSALCQDRHGPTIRQRGRVGSPLPRRGRVTIPGT